MHRQQSTAYAMADTSRRRPRKSHQEIDISTNASQPGLGWRGNVVLWGGFLALLAAFYYFEFSLWTLLILVPLVILAGLIWIAWFVVYRRGVFTWMRLATKPARLLAAGDRENAERVLKQALERARRFPPDDHRRGIMLCELAMFVKLQGRQTEAIELYEESIEILARDAAKEPLDYFIGLNNYGICFIHVKDYESAQRILEKAVDMILAARKHEAGKYPKIALANVQSLEFLLRLNLAFLFMEMRELHEAELQLRDADVLAPLLQSKVMAQWNDHYAAICAMWEFQAGNFQLAEEELARAKNPDYPACLRMRMKLHIVRMEFAKAEALARVFQAAEHKRGVLHRPEMLSPTLDLSEALFGLGKQEAAFATFEEARAIVVDYAIPSDVAWRKLLELWLKRARDSKRSELAEALEKDLAKIASLPSKATTILDKFKSRSV